MDRVAYAIIRGKPENTILDYSYKINHTIPAATSSKAGVLSSLPVGLRPLGRMDVQVPVKKGKNRTRKERLPQNKDARKKQGREEKNKDARKKDAGMCPQ